ncbi:piggyBac transposable element-derived protein 3-like [Amyelois transitella]|uniref:piggyBac transposable element-derived protein 3-like n=1 Tax=Amyelois transitella TaxID=680683 RepID=UPI0029904601|nr:piggyBac transposable element-derived protein 3-like [Amyelois transitella]
MIDPKRIMARKRLFEEEIIHFLTIPSGSEDGEDSSAADSDEDTERLRSTLSFLPESLNDMEANQCPSTNEDTSHENRHEPSPRPSTSGAISEPTAGSPGYDRLHKIRPLLETLKKKCQSIPKREALSVDEQMCATKASNFLRQYLPNKPHKWGYKLFILCDDRGFAYDFEIYSGMENDPNLRSSTEPDLGASANIVVRLARFIPRDQQYKLYFDNYYTSPELISYLSKQGIQSLGTLNKGRLGKDLNIPSLKDLKKDKIDRGSSEEWVANVDDTEIATIMWYDNKPVVLSSSFVGREPVHQVKRYCKKAKKYIYVDCPQIVKIYNQHMGGVDLLDSFLGKYKIKIRTRKWYLRLFYHLLDVVVINSWLLYRRVGEQNGTPTPLKLRDFKFEVAKSLCMSGLSMNKKRGRPSSASTEIELKRTKRNTAILPPPDVRSDGFEHYPIWGLKRQRCVRCDISIRIPPLMLRRDLDEFQSDLHHRSSVMRRDAALLFLH